MLWRFRMAAKTAVINAHRRFHEIAGSRQFYELPPGYRHRQEPKNFDDTGNEDHWQREVYEFAAALAAEKGLRTVYDIGCGSAFKLVHFLGSYDTVGFDVEPTVKILRERYPTRRWELADFSRALPSPDLVVCSDVVEHVADPDVLMRHIAGLNARHTVLSTPDRDLLYEEYDFHRLGPPHNPTHLREWNAKEFKPYVQRFFEVLDHRITNREQATQMIYCRSIPQARSGPSGST